MAADNTPPDRLDQSPHDGDPGSSAVDTPGHDIGHTTVVGIGASAGGQRAIRRKPIDFEFTTGAESIPAVTDGGKLRQIITNLVGNAIKFTDSGSVRAHIHVDDGQIIVTVRDTGPGIPEDRLEDIIKPFFQVDSTTAREEGGTGLGLAVSRRLADLLGGGVSVDSAPGKGSTFTLRLPHRPPEA